MDLNQRKLDALDIRINLKELHGTFCNKWCLNQSLDAMLNVVGWCYFVR